MPVITTFGGMSARGFGFSGGVILPATSFITITAGTTTNTVPLGYNAVHIQAAVGGGGGSICGADYDKAGGESTSYLVILCSSFFTLAFKRLLKAGESLHFVKPPISANAVFGVNIKKAIRINSIKLMRFITKKLKLLVW